jgi:hypothetical protein
MRAVIQGKSPTGEDGVTGTVFSVLRWLPPEAGLLPLLESAFPNWTPVWGAKSQLLFWPRFADGTEPDLVIVTDDSAVVVEAKTGSPFGLDQLQREWDGLRGWGPAAGLDRRLLAITTDATLPHEVATHGEAVGTPERVGWMSWTHVLRCIRQGREERSAGEQRMVDDLDAYLHRQGVVMDFTGISQDDAYAAALGVRALAQRLNPQIAALKPALEAELQPDIVWGDTQNRFFTYISRATGSPHQWSPRTPLLLFRDATWPLMKDPRRALLVGIELERAVGFAGARLSLPKDDDGREGLLAAVRDLQGWEAVAGAWDVAEHAAPAPASTLTASMVDEQVLHSQARTVGDPYLWIRRSRPAWEVDVAWCVDTLRACRTALDDASVLDWVA